MIWVRRLVAALVGAAFLLIFGGATLGLVGLLPLQSVSAPGLGKEDSEALAAPFADLMGRHDEALAKRFVEGTDLHDANAAFKAMRDAVPLEQPTSSRLIQWFAFYGANGTRLSGIHEQSRADRVVRITTEILKPAAGGEWRLINFDVRSAPIDALAANKFSFIGRPLAVQAVITATFVVLVLTCITALACLLLRDVTWRWLWLLFIVFGLTTFRMDTNGAWTFQPISFQLFSGGFMWSGSAFQPWSFGVSMPVGAIAFWIVQLRRRNRALEKSESARKAF